MNRGRGSKHRKFSFNNSCGENYHQRSGIWDELLIGSEKSFTEKPAVRGGRVRGRRSEGRRCTDGVNMKEERMFESKELTFKKERHWYRARRISTTNCTVCIHGQELVTGSGNRKMCICTRIHIRTCRRFLWWDVDLD